MVSDLILVEEAYYSFNDGYPEALNWFSKYLKLFVTGNEFSPLIIEAFQTQNHSLIELLNLNEIEEYIEDAKENIIKTTDINASEITIKNGQLGRLFYADAIRPIYHSDKIKNNDCEPISIFDDFVRVYHIDFTRNITDIKITIEDNQLVILVYEQNKAVPNKIIREPLYLYSALKKLQENLPYVTPLQLQIAFLSLDTDELCCLNAHVLEQHDYRFLEISSSEGHNNYYKDMIFN